MTPTDDDPIDAIAVTIDVDWVPTPVLEDTVELLDDHDVSATIFSTHEDGLSLPDHERAIHPNFSKDRPPADLIADLLDTYPDARGLRSHSLHVSTELRSAYPDTIEYESNYMLFGQEWIRPFWISDSIVQIPIYFMDDVRMRHGSPAISPKGELEKSGVRVYCFHPIHVYLNTPTLEYYADHKDDYSDPGALRAARFDGDGIRRMFVSLLEELERGNVETKLLGSVADGFATSVSPEEGLGL